MSLYLSLSAAGSTTAPPGLRLRMDEECGGKVRMYVSACD
jgi:hypothetical protein